MFDCSVPMFDVSVPVFGAMSNPLAYLGQKPVLWARLIE